MSVVAARLRVNTDKTSLNFSQNPGGGTLSGTLTKAAWAGVAVVDNLSINKTGTGYTLMANSGGLSSATSNPFNIGASTASNLVFMTSPRATAASASWSPALRVAIYDNAANLEQKLYSALHHKVART